MLLKLVNTTLLLVGKLLVVGKLLADGKLLVVGKHLADFNLFCVGKYLRYQTFSVNTNVNRFGISDNLRETLKVHFTCNN